MANKRIHDLDDTATTLDSGAYFAVDSDSYTAAKKFAADTLPDPTGATDGYVWTADGANGAAWEAVSGGASDVTDLTTTTGSSTNMVRVAAAGGLEYRTVAQVLSDIGAAAASHTHGAGDIASGTLVHERGGLEADVSAYAGLVKISGGSTSAVTVTAFGESLIDDSDASTARTTLGLGTMATEATGSYLAATGATTGATSSAQDFTNGLTVAGGSNGISSAGVVTGTRGIFGAAGTVLIGSGAASVATGGSWTAIGANAGAASTTGGSWTAIGNNAGAASTTGSSWTAIGNLAGDANTTGSSWTAIGYAAGTANTTGTGWTAIGYAAGTANTTGSSWTAIGYLAGDANTTGTGWTAIGSNAGTANTTGTGWTAIGSNAGTANTTGTGWTAIGDNAGAANTTGTGWTAIGYLAGDANTTGGSWMAIGYLAGTTSTTGTGWTAIGANAGAASTTGSSWTAIGNAAGYTNTTGGSWTAIGNNAGRYINSGGNAATNTTFVAIGDDARLSTDGTSNEIVIGYQSRGNGSNTTTIGNSSTTHFYGLGIHVLPSGGAPASASATGTAGSIVWDADYIYICTATDTWKRAAISTWA